MPDTAHMRDRFYYWDRFHPLSGLPLRYALCVCLMDAGRPMTVRRLIVALERRGFEVAGRPSKTVSDSLRREVARGRVLRRRRGEYVVGRVAQTTEYRMRTRVTAMTGGEWRSPNRNRELLTPKSPA